MSTHLFGNRRRWGRYLGPSVAFVAALGSLSLAPASAATGGISGAAFQDANRNGVRDAGEAAFANHRIYLYDAAKTRFVAAASTDAQGQYAFTGVADGSYLVEYESSTWSALRNDWVPTTTGSLRPSVVTTPGTSVDFGWRPIVRSTTLGSPISRYTASNGLRVDSYDDAVPAATVAAALANGSLSTGEASTTVVNFDIGSATDAVTSVSGGPGSYSGFSATLWIGYPSWLDTYDHVLFHEYGHAWAEYNAHIAQQDESLSSYLSARGISGDSRLYSSKAWDPHEMIAEDYRQLFGSTTAAAYPQANVDVPPAAQVTGLREFLRDTFTARSSTGSGGSTTTTTTTAPPPTSSAVAVTGLGVSPAPVTRSGTVAFTLSGQATTTVEIVSPSGSVVRTLLNSVAENSGTVSAKWDRKDDRGRRVPSGNYTSRVRATNGAGTTTAQAAFTVN